MDTVLMHGKLAKKASVELANASSETKNNLLLKMAEALEKKSGEILNANKIDCDNAKKSEMSTAMLDRLRLDKGRILDMASGIREIVALADPVGQTLSGTTRGNGLIINKVTIPLGVIAMIYEARPNVTADAAALCIKAGNAVILRGGREAIHSNTAIATVLRSAITEMGENPDIIRFIEDTSRESSAQLMQMNDYVDVLIPRGGAGLIESVVKNATVPVIKTGDGNCHIFIDETADVDMAVAIMENAKVQRPSVCNAVETMIIHSKILEKALPAVAKNLISHKVELRGDDRARNVFANMKTATDDDWATEYQDYILAIKTVDSLEEAMEHIEKYSTHHSESIVTESYANAEKFKKQVDSATVYVNASTRFTDGGQFGLGAEIGISTQKLHARGPVGLSELVTIKFLIDGSGQVRS